MGTVPDPKRETTAEMVPQSEVLVSGKSRDSCASEKPTQHSKPLSAPVEQLSHVSVKTNDGGMRKSSVNDLLSNREASKTSIPFTPDHENSTSGLSTAAKEKSTFTSSDAVHKKCAVTSSAGDHGKSTSTSSPRDDKKSTITSCTENDRKPTITTTLEDTRNSTLTSSSADGKSIITSCSGDQGKSTISLSPEDKKKSIVTSFQRDDGKSTISSCAGDHEKPTISSSPEDHWKSTVISCPRDDGESTITSSTKDYDKSTITSSTGNQGKSTSTSSTEDHWKSKVTSSSKDDGKSTITSLAEDHGKSTITSSADCGKSASTSSSGDCGESELLSRKNVEMGKISLGGCVSDVTSSHEDGNVTLRVSPSDAKEGICKNKMSSSAATSPKVRSQINDSRDSMESSAKVQEQSIDDGVTEKYEYSPASLYQTNVVRRSDQVLHPTHSAPLTVTTKQEKNPEFRSSCKNTSLLAELKDVKDGPRLPCVSPKDSVQTENCSQSCEGESTTCLTANLQQDKREKSRSPEAECNTATRASNATSASAHKSAPGSLMKEARDSELISCNHRSSVPQSHTYSPSGAPNKLADVLTVAGPSQTSDAAAEDHNALRGFSLRYKEVATMTVSAQHPVASNLTCRDAGVQAVASVCSRSVGTSPSLSSQGGPLELNGMVTDVQETLTVTCQRGGRSAYQITMDNSRSSQSGILSDACGHTLVSSQVQRESTHHSSKQICDHLPGRDKLKADQCSNQTAGVKQHSDSGRGPGSTQKEPVDTAQKWLPLLQPVYQINIEPCGQSKVSSNDSPCGKTSPVSDPACNRKSGAETGSSVHEGVGRRIPESKASSDMCQLPVNTVALPKHPIKSLSDRLTSSLEDGLLPGAVTVAECERDDEKASPSPLKAAQEGKEAGGQLNKDLKQPTPLKGDGRIQKLDQGGDNRDKKKEKTSDGSQRNPEGRKKQKQSGSREKAGPQAKAKGVHDVVWDEQGMTWEVYGASADPESLGFAIQNHLQSKIREQERLIKVQMERRRSGVSASPAGKRSKRRRSNVFRSLMKNVRRPKCCGRPPPSSILE